jgi:hypothetical protein
MTEDEVQGAVAELLDQGLIEVVPDDDDVAAIAARWLDLEAQREQIVDEQDELKSVLRKLPTGTYHTDRASVIIAEPTRRFSPEQAAKVLPPETLRDVERRVIDRELAQRILPPALYRMCQVTPAGAVPVVRIR